MTTGKPPSPDPGSDQWFTENVWPWTSHVYRYITRRTGTADAEDLTADVLAIAWRRRADIPVEAPLAWLYRTAGYVLANYWRRQRPLLVETLPDEPDLADPAWYAIRDDTVVQVLRQLSPRDRQILLLNAWEGLQGEALASVLGITRGGADAALSRARARLRELWPTDASNDPPETQN